MRPNKAEPARAHGLPKNHKFFLNIPKFRPIIETSGTSHCLVVIYLPSLLYPITANEFSLKDSFDAANEERYTIISFRKWLPIRIFSCGIISHQCSHQMSC